MTRMPLAVVGLFLATSLAGCASAEMRVQGDNRTDEAVLLQVWINHAQEPSWHRAVLVPAGAKVTLGTFDGPAHNDYHMVAVAGGLRVERASQQLGNSYPDWTLRIHEDRIEDVLMVY